MTDDSSSSGLPIIVPADVREKFSALVDMILASESMNDDERRYWIDILPVMNQEQIDKLQDILVREKNQLAAIDAKYAKEMTNVADAETIERMGDQRRERNAQRASTEAEAKATDSQATDGLLDQIDSI